MAALPHDAGAGASGLLEDSLGSGEIGAPCAIAHAPLFRPKRALSAIVGVVRNTSFRMKVFRRAGISRRAIQVVIYQ